MRLKRLAPLLVLALSGSLSAMTLEQSVADAFGSHPSISQQYARYLASLSDEQAAFADYLPQLRAYGGIGIEQTDYNNGQRVDNELTRREIGAKLTQLLFDGFRTPAENARLSAEAEAERLNLISTANDLALDVAGAYIDLVRHEQLVALATRNVQEHHQILDDIEGRYGKGLSSQSDVAQVQARVATSEAALLSAQNNLVDTQARFFQLVGTSPEKVWEPMPDADYLPASLEVALNNAVHNHPELAAADSDMEAVKAEKRRSESGYYPHFNIEAVANRADDIGGYEGRDQDARVMLTMEYDLFNGGKTMAQSRASAYRYEEARSVRQRAQRQLEEGTKLSWNAYQMLDKQMNFYQQNVDAAYQAELGYVKQFQLGKRTLLDVLDAKVEVFLARRNYVDAYFDHRLAAYRLLNAQGNLIGALRVDVPSQWQGEDHE